MKNRLIDILVVSATVICFVAIVCLTTWMIFVVWFSDDIPLSVIESESTIIKWSTETDPFVTEELMLPSFECQFGQHSGNDEVETEIDVVESSESEENFCEGENYKCQWADLTLTEEEFALICTTVFCEGQTTSTETQILIALAILNQIVSGDFGDSVKEVIYRPNNFAVTKWKDFESRGWSDKVEQSVLCALEHNEHPSDMFYFRTDRYHGFGTPYTNRDNVYFSTN